MSKKRFSLEEWQATQKTHPADMPALAPLLLPNLQIPILHIEEKNSYEQAVEKIGNAQSLAIDLEFDDSNKFYGRHLSLVQVFDGEQIFIFDVVRQPQIEKLLAILTDENLNKVFHGCTSDLLILDELYHCRVKNIDDTAMMHRFLFVINNDISLQNLLQEKLNITLDKQEQVSDWISRPLSESQIIYAATDVAYLFELKTLLLAELEAHQTLDWYQSERKALENLHYEEDPHHAYHFAIKNGLELRQVLFFVAFWHLRNQVAQFLNIPPYKVTHNNNLLYLVQNPPLSLEGWKKSKGLHPELKTAENLQRLHECFVKSQKPEQSPYYPTWLEVQASQKKVVETKRKFHKQMQAREKIFDTLRNYAKDYRGKNLQSLLFSNRNKTNIVYHGYESQYSSWKIEVIEDLAAQHQISIAELKKGLHDLEDLA
ncbi:ribonuclease D [Hugenholtzia roseola]|uniref:ribonuclease D n=1 Tax=Hugenholtzia roseola TaxID=1002 RepID=UPI00041DAF13|nr:ribonuclease D [Hugenholtzia roseola]